MFKVIIEQLLTLKSNLHTEKDQKILEAVQNIEQEYAEKELKIGNLLNECGYVEPQVDNVDNNVETQVNEVDYNV